MSITATDCVQALKKRKLSTSASALAAWIGTDSRAVATALRGPVRDGLVTISFKRGIGFYRFVRLNKKATP